MLKQLKTINTPTIVIEKSPIVVKPNIVTPSKIATKPEKVDKPKIVDKSCNKTAEKHIKKLFDAKKK